MSDHVEKESTDLLLREESTKEIYLKEPCFD